MEFIDLKLTIEVSFATMTREQYLQFSEFFKREFGQEKPIDNQKLIDYLALDKRPFRVASIENPILKGDLEDNIKNAEIEIIC